MKHDVIRDEFTSIGRIDILPVDARAQVDNVCAGIGDFPGGGDIAFHKIIRTETDPVIKHCGIQSPVVTMDFLHERGVDAHACPGVGIIIYNIPVQTKGNCPAVLRRTQFIPPVACGGSCGSGRR